MTALNDQSCPQINILGIRGIPGNHGGFETFATHFATYLVAENVPVTVYCQAEEGTSRPNRRSDDWKGVRRIHIQTRTRGALASVEFDLRSILHVLSEPGVDLVLGYNTAVFCLLQRLFDRTVAMNMDGIEWKRQKWGKFAKAWFWLNEWIAARICHLPIADHPEIANHIAARGCRRSIVIPYGSERILDASLQHLKPFGVRPDEFFLTICRIEPENSILEIVEAFAAARTGMTLVVLGQLRVGNLYHERIRKAATDKIIFPGPIYDPDVLRALRFHCRAYVHGHQVGGTNPSLVEALGAGNAIVARDNRFNRWVAGEGQLYFSGIDDCVAALRAAACDSQVIASARAAAKRRHAEDFTFDRVHSAYLTALAALPPAARKDAGPGTETMPAGHLTRQTVPVRDTVTGKAARSPEQNRDRALQQPRESAPLAPADIERQS